MAERRLLPVDITTHADGSWTMSSLHDERHGLTMSGDIDLDILHLIDLPNRATVSAAAAALRPELPNRAADLDQFADALRRIQRG